MQQSHAPGIRAPVGDQTLRLHLRPYSNFVRVVPLADITTRATRQA